MLGSVRRPELFRLLGDCQSGDVLLVEQVDRLSRLNGEDWDKHKAEIRARRVRVVALDLPTSWQMLAQERAQDLTSRIFEAINDMLLDMLAAVARKDYEDRRQRTLQGIERAKAIRKVVKEWVNSQLNMTRPVSGFASPFSPYANGPHCKGDGISSDDSANHGLP